MYFYWIDQIKLTAFISELSVESRTSPGKYFGGIYNKNNPLCTGLENDLNEPNAFL